MRLRLSATRDHNRDSGNHAAKREAAIYYKTVLLPLKQRIVEQSQLEYNGMLIGLFQLLQAKRDQVEAAAA